MSTATASTVTAPKYVSTTNACKLCMPMGACLAFKGVEGCVPFLHGSQGCATYMRRYLISHFREPVDIASSSLGEKEAVFGGGPNLKQGLVNVINKYQAKLVGVATTCLTETIGDDVPALVREFNRQARVEGSSCGPPPIVTVSSPSYGGSHLLGFHRAVAALVEQLADGPGPRHDGINLLPGLVSPADLRYLRELAEDFGLTAAILPDYSQTLDGVASAEYQLIPDGGTPLAAIRAMGRAAATLELGRSLEGLASAGRILERAGVPLVSLAAPIGLRESDRLMAALERLSGRGLPEKHRRERGQLLDAFVDGHKYLSGVTAVVYGDEDLALGLTSFLCEIGVQPLLVATGGELGQMPAWIEAACAGLTPQAPQVITGADFWQIAEQARVLKPDLILGNSKGQRLARELKAPLVRVGFPIHDRFGAQRLVSLGYRGAQQLYDRIVNAVLAHRQEASPVGYGYL
ncbi:MAG: nitrogenase component 1 [Thermodesulfobacteriota bacterium]